ncbi:hypothetical protein D9M71_836960 [compost metagenome]
MATAQAGRLGIRRETMFFDDRAHALNGGAADALLFGLAIDDVTGGGDGHTGQLGYITEFQPAIPCFLELASTFSPILPDSGRRPWSQRIRQVGLQRCTIIE